MEKTILCFLILSGCYCFCTAQQVSSSGGYEEKSTVSVDWILGGSLSDIPPNDITSTNIISDQDQAEPGFKIFPVPATDFINIEFTSTDTCHLFLELYNSSGIKVLDRVSVTKPFGQYDVRKLPSGVYLLKLYIKSSELPLRVEKIIKN